MPEAPTGGQLTERPRAGPTQGKLSYTEIMEAFTQYVESERPRVEGPSEVVELMRPVLANKEQEELHVLLLDAKHHLLRDELVTIGLVDRSQVHAREVFRSAIRESCSRLILVHSHPSGDPTPSAQDIDCTRELVSAGKIIGIELLDHVIIGRRTQSRPRDYLSFREEGLL